MVALAAGVAGRREPHTAAAHIVDHVALENALLDQHIFLRHMAFIVDVDRAPGIGDGAVIDGGNLFVGNFLTQLAGKLALSVGNGGCFQAVAAGLMENNTAEAVFDGHGHDLGGAVAGTGHGDRLTGRVDANILRQNSFKHLKAHAAAGVAGAGLGTVALVGNRINHHTGTNLAVLGIQALRSCQQNVVVHIQQRSGNLGDAGIVFLRGKITFLQDRHLFLVGNRGGNDPDGMGIAEDALFQHNVNGCVALTQRIRSRLCTAEETHFAGVHGGGHDGAQALVHAYGCTRNDRILDGIDLACNHIDGVIGGVLRKNFRIISAGGYRFLQNTLANFS